MNKSVIKRLEALEQVTSNEVPLATLYFNNGDTKVLTNLKISFCLLCGVVADAKHRTIVKIELTEAGKQERALQIASQFVNGE